MRSNLPLASSRNCSTIGSTGAGGAAGGAAGVATALAGASLPSVAAGFDGDVSGAGGTVAGAADVGTSSPPERAAAGCCVGAEVSGLAAALTAATFGTSSPPLKSAGRELVAPRLFLMKA